MRQPNSRRGITSDQYDAVLLDLDGVITDTANLHAACWKQMFDEYLQKRATQGGEAFRPFDLAMDYRLYVDGKPRFDGVRDFLTSRGIQLPEGSPDDPPRDPSLQRSASSNPPANRERIISRGAFSHSQGQSRWLGNVCRWSAHLPIAIIGDVPKLRFGSLEIKQRRDGPLRPQAV